MTEAEESKETKDGTEGALGFQEDTTADPSKATEAVEKPAEPAAEPVKPIYLAGRAFTNRTELQDHVKKIQDSKVNEDASKGDLTVEENLFIFHLLLHHPKAVEKMTKPISHFRYGTYDKFKNKCFISVAVDGTEEGVSAAKSMSVIFPNTSGNGAAATSSATAGLVAVPPPDEKKEKGQKRNREERPPPEPRVFEPQEMVRGCVVDIKGLPPNVNYGRLKELLNGCGKVKFLQLLKVPKASKEPPQKKAKVEEEGAEKADAADAAEGEKDEDPAKEEEAEEEEESPVTARAGEDVHAASAAHGGRGEGKEQGHEAAEPSNFGGSMAHHPAQPPIQPERGPEAVTTITEVSQAAQTMVIGATGDAGTLLQPHAELPAVAEEAIQADADRQADASASQSRLDQLGVSQTSMQGSHGSQGVSQTSFHVSQTTFQVSQSTFQASHTTFDPGEPTQSTFQTGHNANLFNSTAPAVVGVQQGPRVPPLWDPHPRSDGFYGWEARSPSDASDADHPALPADTLPTFVPAVDDRDATLPASDLHGHWADPGAQTVKPHSGFTARSGYSDDSSGQSPRPGQPIVNTSILTQLCNLLNAPDTPDSEVERVRRGPLRKVRTPEEQSPAWGGGVPSASAASPISPFQAETEVTITTSPAKTKKSMHSAARSADETLPSLHPSTSGPHDAYGHEDDQSPFQTVPMFQSDLHSPPERRDRRVPEEPAADLFQRRTPRSHQEAEELVDPNLISQLCHLLNAPDTPSSAAAAAAAAAAAEVHKPSRAAAATAEASKVKQPSRAKPAEETLQRPSDPMSGWAEPGETLPMFQSDLHSPQTPDERRARRDREHARHRADPFDMDFDQTATARTDEESRQQSLVDPNLIAQLCRLLNQPETPPSDTERIRREPPPRRAKEQPGLFRADPQIGGESQPHTARTSVRSRGTASDQASGDSDVNEALEEDVFNIMDMLCVQIEEPQA